MEQTFVLLKPDALNKKIIGEVVSRFERKGLKIVGLKMIQLTDELCKAHYAHHATKSFFPGLKKFVCSTPVVCMVLEGKDAVEAVRKMCGVTNSREAAPGTIRGDYSLSVQSNIIHASDSLETAYKEIERFFSPSEVHEYTLELDKVAYADDERANRSKIKKR
ncbi:nucleoside-diphosphate kinase [Candidatus Micrarchaeota archaeon]|nr:nucleoside-diphosphate kinase [Candidatus Micrarchaeota archaeon]